MGCCTWDRRMARSMPWSPRPMDFLYAVDPESGKAKWVISLPDAGRITAPTTAEGLVLFAVEPQFSPSYRDHRATLYAVNVADGQVTWKVDAQGSWIQLLIADHTIYFRTDKTLLALGLETGHQLWSFSAADGIRISTGLLADDQRVYVLTEKDSIIGPKSTLHALALTTGQEQWSLRRAQRIRAAHRARQPRVVDHAAGVVRGPRIGSLPARRGRGTLRAAEGAHGAGSGARAARDRSVDGVRGTRAARARRHRGGRAVRAAPAGA